MPLWSVRTRNVPSRSGAGSSSRIVTFPGSVTTTLCSRTGRLAGHGDRSAGGGCLGDGQGQQVGAQRLAVRCPDVVGDAAYRVDECPVDCHAGGVGISRIAALTTSVVDYQFLLADGEREVVGVHVEARPVLPSQGAGGGQRADRTTGEAQRRGGGAVDVGAVHAWRRAVAGGGNLDHL